MKKKIVLPHTAEKKPYLLSFTVILQFFAVKSTEIFSSVS